MAGRVCPWEGVGGCVLEGGAGACVGGWGGRLVVFGGWVVVGGLRGAAV